jgi:hypothetical protein
VKQSGRLGFIFALALLASHPAAAQRRTLDIYFIDVEGGQSTLVVTPGGQTLLIDTGFPGDGTFASLPGDPHKARLAQRVLVAWNEVKAAKRVREEGQDHASEPIAKGMNAGYRSRQLSKRGLARRRQDKSSFHAAPLGGHTRRRVWPL